MKEMVALARAEAVADADPKKKWLWEQSRDEAGAADRTEPTRIERRQYYMLYWLCQLLERESADLLGELLGPSLETMFNQNAARIEELRKKKIETEHIKLAARNDLNDLKTAPPPDRPKKK